MTPGDQAEAVANKQGKQCCSTGSLYVLYMLTD